MDEVGNVFFSPQKMEQFSQEQRRRIFELAISDQRLDALALASQLEVYIQWWETDPFQQAKHGLAMAERLLQEGIVSPTTALLRRVVDMQLDAVLPEGHSLRRQAEMHWANLSSSPFVRSRLLADLVWHYPGDAQLQARWYYALGENLEQIQRWDEAMQAYQQFANYPDVTIPNVSNAHSIVKSKLSIYHSKRNWVTSDDLGALVSDIRYTIQKQLRRDIGRYLANDFFAISGNFTNDSLRRGDINLANFLSPRVRFGDFTPESNDREAWLETYNWPLTINRWYLYFRRIDYPANPDIDGRWEWAGIFIGELL